MDYVNTAPGWFNPLWVLPLVAVLLVSQAVWIYLDAAKRGENKFIWGFLGLFNCPGSLLLYLLVTRAFVKTKPCPACGKRIGAKARFCPECGERQADPPQGRAKKH